MPSKPLTLRQRLTVLWRGQLSSPPETEQSISILSRVFANPPRDRLCADRTSVLEDALDAWRFNPLARRIVGLTTQYVVGSGINLNCRHQPTRRFLQEFWENSLNRMTTRVYEFCDELTRTGNLFMLITTDPSGMSYVRAIPADQVESITARPNDVEQPLCFTPKPTPEQPNPTAWSAYHPQDNPLEEEGFKPVMLHYTINRPVGAQWGESDLAPILKWLSRYTAWLEDRARLNRFRNAFLFTVTAPFTSEQERQTRQSLLAANPPTPGSILVCDENEKWEVLSPKLDSYEANADGLSLKKMIASGVGIPLHFLAEPEGATRTTAEAAGGPTYRHFEQRQKYFLWILADLLQVVLQRRALVDHHINRRAAFSLSGSDISSRDNVALSLSTANITNAMSTLRDRELVDDQEFLKMVYRFANEPVDLEEMLTRARQPNKPTRQTPPAARPRSQQPPIDLETGEPPTQRPQAGL